MTWQSMGAGDVTMNEPCGPLMLCRNMPTAWPVGHS